MKKLTALFLCLILLFTLTACPQNTAPPNNGETPAGPSTDMPDTGTPQPGGGGFDYEQYKQITPLSYREQQELHYGFEGDELVLRLSLPAAWDVVWEETGAMLFYEGKDIGGIMPGYYAPTENNNRVMEEESYRAGGVDSVSRLFAIPDATPPTVTFRRVQNFTYYVGDTEREVSLYVNYAALDKAGADNIFKTAAAIVPYGDPYRGLLSDLPENATVAVFGNSFISSSQIGTFLRQMFAGTDYTVITQSRGYASISRQSWEDELDNLRNGIYDVAFFCGFYNETDAHMFAPYVKACKESGTRLVLFPAHNESGSHYATDVYYPDLPALNWRGEIDLLIEEFGIDYWDFCINDTHKHSTPAAGYVGAHMIYRAITGECPPPEDYTNMPFDELYSLLGDYTVTGAVGELTENIWYFPL